MTQALLPLTTQLLSRPSSSLGPATVRWILPINASMLAGPQESSARASSSNGRQKYKERKALVPPFNCMGSPAM